MSAAIERRERQREYERAYRERRRTGATSNYHNAVDPVQRLLRQAVCCLASGCWQWTGRVNRQGYGVTMLDQRRHSAARAILLLLGGPIEPGIEPDHLCRNRACINPAHLDPVTHQENSRRAGLARRRDVCTRGHALVVSSGGIRRCRECTAARQRAFRARRKAVAA